MDTCAYLFSVLVLHVHMYEDAATQANLCRFRGECVAALEVVAARSRDSPGRPSLAAETAARLLFRLSQA
jgi:hypothetical protein